MTTTTRLLFAGLLPLTLLACAGDRNRPANGASELVTERALVSADEPSERRVAAAEVYFPESAQADDGGSEAPPESAAADAKITEARTIHRAQATARLESADVRTSALWKQFDHAVATPTASSRDSLQRVTTQRSNVTMELDQTARVANEGWQRARARLDSELDTLEGLVKKSGTEMSKSPR